MSKIHLFLTGLIGCMLILPVRAQDERVHPYMQAVSKAFRMDQGYELEIDYVREDIMQETRVEGDGSILMKGLMYKMTVDEYIVYYDGKKQYAHNTDMEEVYVSAPDPEDAAYLQAVPMSVIKSYQKDFKYQFMGERPFKGKPHIEIQLYPRELTGPYSMLKLFIHPRSMKLSGFVLKHKEGIHYTMILKSIRENANLDGNSFRFDPSAYPDTEVIELIE